MHKKASRHYLVQPESVTLEDRQRLGVDGLSMVGPARQDVPPPPVSLGQGDTHGVWQEDQCQQEASDIECGCGPELVPANTTTRCQPSMDQAHSISYLILLHMPFDAGKAVPQNCTLTATPAFPNKAAIASESKQNSTAADQVTRQKVQQ